MALRPRAATDFDALVHMLAQVARTDGYPNHWPEDPVEWIRTRDALQAWVCEEDGDLLGHVVLRRAGRHKPVVLWSLATGEDAAACAVVARLFVAGPARGRGVGRALVEAAWQTAADLRLRPLLDVVDSNRAAIRLYHRLGWTHFGSYRDTFHRDGPTELLHCFAAVRSDCAG